jgi:hypothetical protein
MVFVPGVTGFLSSAQALVTSSPTTRLLIKYSGSGALSLKVTDNKQVRPRPLCPPSVSPSCRPSLLCCLCFSSLLTPHKTVRPRQTLTYRTKQRDDLKHMDRLSLHVLTAATAEGRAGAAAGGSGGGGSGSAAAAAAAAAAAPPARAARKAAPGSGAQRKKLATAARLAEGKGGVGARTLARREAKAQREAQRRSRRQERREVRLLAGGSAAPAASTASSSS